MQETKKQLEILLANYFRHVFKDFPKCRIVPSESPDFLLKLSPKRQIGLELTRINPTGIVSELERKENLELQIQVILRAKELFENHSKLS